MSFNEHGNIELAPTTTKGTGAFVMIFGPGVHHLDLQHLAAVLDLRCYRSRRNVQQFPFI